MKFTKLIYLILTVLISLNTHLLHAKNAPVNITITGATEEPLQGNVHIFCTKSESLIDGKHFPELDITMLKGLYQFNLTFPLQTELGKHPMIGSQDYPAERAKMVKVRYRDGKAKGFKTGSGEIELIKLPKAQGDQFIADLSAELSSRKGDKVSIKVKIDAKAGFQSFDECPAM